MDNSRNCVVESETEKIANVQNEQEVKEIKSKIKSNMTTKDIVLRFANRAALFFLGYIICYLNWSITLPILTICTLVWFETKTSDKSRKISSKSKASSLTEKDVLKAIDELPSWVTFPDRERAEWLNEIILQLWPSISSFIVKRCRGSLQTKIRRKFESFRFEDIDFGVTPPKIDGVKVYNRTITKDSIVIDFDVFYDGDCDINFSISGTQIGSIRDFQVGAELRLVLKPLMIKMPIVGGIQLFFLNTPDINFELEGLSGIPGLSYFIRQKIEEKITKKLVFPNKITKRFSKSVEAVELKSLEPAGVLRVHVFEAKDLERKDVTGKSDPYVILTVGAQECRTHVIKRDLNPKWDYWCEFVILDPIGQHLQFKLFDQDDLNEDDFLGSGIVEIHHVIKEGKNDKWFTLDNAKHGKLHLRFTWLGLSADQGTLDTVSLETKLLKVTNISTALLTIYLDTAQDLQKVKSKNQIHMYPYVVLTVGKVQQKSKVKKHTVDPVWEQGFSLLVANPDSDSLNLSIVDKNSDSKLDQLVYSIKNLFDFPDLQISKEEFPLTNSGKIILSLQLRILKHEQFVCDESSSDSDTEEFSRTHSVRSSTMSHRSISSSSGNSPPPKSPQPIAEVSEVGEDTIKKSSSNSQNLMRNPSFRVKPDLGQLELTLFYSAPRQKLIVTVHKIANLPLKDPSDIPDPYVKLKLISSGSHRIKNKTKVVTDNCDPIFEETFEYLLSLSELPNNKLVLTVKSKKIFFNSNIIGQVIVNFRSFTNLQEPFRDWFELSQAEDSD
ncbi:LOW QUALITY PROTEIN: extended synaptotagmin-2 [Leptinotarsa decemlineata]|uniref:LOW QUALITY PROTEIN: extended synaptotagmin-2 n=1 Tax=Leptinotarsa decemlineata TaxID=7539 RepID=UPI003D30B013